MPNREYEMDITGLLHQWRGGSEEARTLLFAATYQQLKKIARGALSREYGRRVDPTELLHEGMILLLRADGIDWKDRAHFKAVAATCMRRVLIEHARRANSQKRQGHHVTLRTQEPLNQPDQQYTIEQIHDAIDGLTKIDPDRAKVAELKLFGGLTNEEIAASESISVTTVKRYWRSSRAWLQQELNPRSD